MSAAVLEREPGSTPAAVLSALVHVALFTSLFFGLRWQSKHPDAVVVELWDRPAVVEPVLPEVPKPEPKAEAKPEPKLEVKPPKPDIAVEKQKKTPPKKKEEPKQVEPEVKIDYDRVMRERMAREMEQVTRAPKAAPAAASAVADNSYINKIRAKIKSNVVLPVDIKGDPEAIFDVAQLPSGDVISARLRKSSGNRAYDEAVERALLKSSPLPKPDRPDQFARDLQLKFRPKE